MTYTVSNFFVTFARFLRNWLFCPETLAIFVFSLVLFNVLRLFRSLFVCFCRWKYKEQNKLIHSSVDKKPNSSNVDEKSDFRTYCHEAKTSDMAVFSLQGRRKTMEDRFNAITHDYQNNYSAYAVFDGHGGEFTAEYIEDQLFRSMRKEFACGSFQANSEAVKSVLTSIIRTVDAQLVCLSRDRMDLSGSTAIIAVQLGNSLTVANIGDSRAVMGTIDGKVIPLSVDHKPSDPKEQKRITDVGGFVTFNGVWRVAGVLATSRAFGDYPLKQRKFVTVEPDFYKVDLSQCQPHFIVLASDGLWDVFKNEEAVEFIRGRLDEPHFGAKSLSLQAYYRGSLDNITVMVVNLRKKRAAQAKFQVNFQNQERDALVSDIPSPSSVQLSQESDVHDEKRERECDDPQDEKRERECNDVNDKEKSNDSKKNV